LVASRFPERADKYVCDNCGADVTEHLHQHAGHSAPPCGPTRYVCGCGRTYLTGAVEWDDLGPRERRKRFIDLFGVGSVLFVVFWIFGIPAGLISYFLLHNARVGIVVGVVVAAVPGLVFPIAEGVGILRSMMRTRFRTPVRTRIAKG